VIVETTYHKKNVSSGMELGALSSIIEHDHLVYNWPESPSDGPPPPFPTMAPDTDGNAAGLVLVVFSVLDQFNICATSLTPALSSGTVFSI